MFDVLVTSLSEPRSGCGRGGNFHDRHIGLGCYTMARRCNVYLVEAGARHSRFSISGDSCGRFRIRDG
eukprot:146408-Pyramimonas_sp.AAC.1